MKYDFIKKNYSKSTSLEKMCQTLGVSRSGYYDWLKRGESKHDKNDRLFLKLIQKSFTESKNRYGYLKVWEELCEKNIPIGKNRVARLMRENNLRSVVKRKFKVTTYSKHKLPISPDLLCRRFFAPAANQIWVSDMTYVRTGEGWLYLATILDVFNRKIVGWSVGKNINTDLLMKAFRRAVEKENPAEGLIFHSDRGSQYASHAFRKELKNKNFKQSMGKSGSYDNAMAESFFHTLKTEMIYHEKYLTREKANLALFEYIEVWYNRKRRHSGLGYKSPIDFVKALEAA